MPSGRAACHKGIALRLRVGRSYRVMRDAPAPPKLPLHRFTSSRGNSEIAVRVASMCLEIRYRFLVDNLPVREQS
jgi:hypothetical protein